jgi:hypothetical protein
MTACDSSTVVLTAASPVVASPGPSGSPGPVRSPRPPLSARQTVYIANTDRLGTDFRQAPGSAGARIRTVPEGAVFEATGREQQVENRIWGEIRDSTGIVGWVLVDDLSRTPPAGATSTPLPGLDAAPPATPTALPFMEPSTTPAPTLGPRATVTLVPTLLPAQQPVLVPLPPDATARPATPTLPRLAPAAATSANFDVDATPSRRPAATSAPTIAPTLRPAGR